MVFYQFKERKAKKMKNFYEVMHLPSGAERFFKYGYFKSKLSIVKHFDRTDFKIDLKELRKVLKSVDNDEMLHCEIEIECLCYGDIYKKFPFRIFSHNFY